MLLSTTFRRSIQPIRRFVSRRVRNPRSIVNTALERLAAEIALSDADNEFLRLEFGYACALRVKHLLEDPEVERCLTDLGNHLSAQSDRESLKTLATESAGLANRHQGSKSIDGCGHAAVSATYAVARAIEGKALEAASYAAYAVVYSQGGYGAVAEPESFKPEFEWQVNSLTLLAKKKHSKGASAV